MFSLPASTVFNKRIPKQKFYDNMEVSAAMKRIFTEQIKIIYWRNKLAASTMNLAPGEKVTEIEVFEIRLNSIPLDEAVLRQIDKVIPYHLIFLLEYEGKVQAWTAYKEVTDGAGKVGAYYHTDWMPEDELPLQVSGLTMDAVYEGFVRQIHNNEELGVRNEEWDESRTLAESIALEEKRKKLLRQIEQIQRKIRKEKQLNVQMRLNAELKRLKSELESM